MIYVDDAKIPFRNWKASHLCSIPFDLGELVEFGKKIDMKEIWIHRDHFDITQEKRERAIAHGATEVTAREMAIMMTDDRKKNPR